LLKKIGIFGGTFDPIHNGHLGIARDLTDHLQLDRVHLVPCHNPPHRPSPKVTSQQRFAMVEGAIANTSGFVADRRELINSSSSYSIDTIESFRREYGNDTALYFFMGMDSLISFSSWYRWQDFLDLCHIVIAARPGSSPPPKDSVIGKYYQLHQTDNTAVLSTSSLTSSLLTSKTHGYMAILPTTPLNITASDIRSQIAAGIKPRNKITEPVWSYIKEYGLYNYTEQTTAQ